MNIFAFAPLSVALLFFAAALTFILLKHPRAQALISFGAIVVTLGLEIALLLAVWGKEPQAVHIGGWEAPFGIVMVVDQLSALMLVVSSTISLAVLVFATGQNLADEDDEVPISVYYPTYLLLIAGVSNAFLAGDLFNLYVGFEILLFASYVLTTMNATTPRIRAGITYVVVSIISSMLFLIAIGFVYASVGTINMADLALKLGTLPEGTRMQLHLMLLIAFGIKAAVFPLSLWLPDSYPTAPAPVTAVFAGLLTKVGVYSIIRTETLLFPGGHLDTLLAIVAILTLLVGILGALAQKDIKRLLSFTLISHIGYMIWGIALGSELGLTTVVFYIAHHIVIQTALFMVVGLLERRAGTTNIDRLGGMLAISPVLAVLYMVPALNLGGIPPFSGFIGKVGLLQASANEGSWQAYAMAGVGVFVSLLTLIALMRVWNKVFWRPVAQAEEPMPELLRAEESEDPSHYVHKPIPASMFYSTLGLVSFGIAITFLATPLFELADRGSDNLFEPNHYIQSVLGDDAPTIEEYVSQTRSAQ